MGGNIVNVLLCVASFRRRRAAGGFGMLLGPEGTGPAPPWGAGFVVSCAGCGSLCSYRFLVFGGCLVGRCVGFVGWWVFVNWIVDASIL
jgi:hypothetical protein